MSEEKERVCTDCRYFVGCECFSGTPCDLYTEKESPTIIKFDGENVFSINRQTDGQVNICISKNVYNVKPDEIKEMRESDILPADYKIELPKKSTFINLCRVLLSFATREELVQIIGNPTSWSNYTIQKRKRRAQK